jgi:hypothetical protein
MQDPKGLVGQWLHRGQINVLIRQHGHDGVSHLCKQTGKNNGRGVGLPLVVVLRAGGSTDYRTSQPDFKKDGSTSLFLATTKVGESDHHGLVDKQLCLSVVPECV